MAADKTAKTTEHNVPASGASETTLPATAPKRTLTDDDINSRFADLVGKAQCGDAKAWSNLQPILAMIPDWEQMYEPPTVYARRALLEATVGANPVVQAAWERRVQALLRELAGADASPLEQSVCERVAVCWLDMTLADLLYAARVKDGVRLEVGEYLQKAKDRAHKRYLSACLALAKVRRLLAPVAQQVNIAQPGAAQMNIAALTARHTSGSRPAAPPTVDADG